MFGLFTQGARQAVVKAQEQARTLNHSYIGTEHLLLGLLDQDDGIAAQALRGVDISLQAARDQVAEIVGRGEQPPGGHIPFTPRAKRTLEMSLRESKRLHHKHIGTEHILLAVLQLDDSVAAQALVGLGTDLDRLRDEVLQRLQ